MKTTYFLIVTAIAEVGTGLALLVAPAIPLARLLGVATPAVDAVFIGRVAGAALLAIGVASGLARNDPGSTALRAVLAGILVYDVAAALLLAYAGLVLRMAGPALWPAVGLHAALSLWCLGCLRFSGAR